MDTNSFFNETIRIAKLLGQLHSLKYTYDSIPKGLELMQIRFYIWLI